MSHRKWGNQDKRNQEWSKVDEQRLKKMAQGNTPTPLIADALGRTLVAIYSKAAELDTTLHPTNKSPYNRLKSK